MKVTAINGSARKDGNTAILIRHVFDELSKEGIETEMIQLAGKHIKGCAACYKCFSKKNLRCVIKSDAFNDYYAGLLKTDGLILASPTYVTDVTAGMKAFVERMSFVSRANDEPFRRKVGAALVAVRRGGAIHAFDSLNHVFLARQMIIPGSIYWNIGIGRDKGEVENDAEGIETMKVLGQNMAWLMKRLQD